MASAISGRRRAPSSTNWRPRTDLLADPAARAHGVRRFAVSVPVLVRGELQPRQPGHPGRLGLVDRGRRGGPPAVPRTVGGVRTGRRLARGDADPGARTFRPAGQRRRPRGVQAVVRRQRRLAGGLRAVHRPQGGERRQALGRVAARGGDLRPRRRRDRAQGAPRPPGGAPLSPVALCHPVGGAAHVRQPPGDPDHRRHPDLRGARQLRRLGQPRPVRSRRARVSAVHRWRPSGQLQPDWPALGEPALRLDPTPGDEVRVVDSPRRRCLRAGGRPAD